MAEENKNNKEWNFSRMGKQTNINFLKSLDFPKPKKKSVTCEDIVLYITGFLPTNSTTVTNVIVRYDPIAHQGIIMSGPQLNNTGDIAMWENKLYNIVGGPGGIDEYEVNYIANTYSFVGNIPGPIGVWMNSVSYNMKDATTLVAHHDESIVHWDISSGTAVPSPQVDIWVLAQGDLINTDQGFMVAYSSNNSTNPPSATRGIAHYDFAGNLIDFVDNVWSAGMFKEHSTGNIFLDARLGPLIASQGLYQLHYAGVPMSLGPMIHSQPYPPTSHPSFPTYNGAVTWQGASSHCFDIPEPSCIDPSALNYDPIATADCNGNIGGTNYSCCEYPCHHPTDWVP